MAIIIPANSAADTGYTVANSCRFNDGDDPYMYKAFGTPTNAKIFTFSVWLKRSKIGFAHIFSVNVDSNNLDEIKFNGDNKLIYDNLYGGGWAFELATSRYFRDVSAWYHIVVAYDSTQATASNRIKFYVNGTQETAFATASYPAEDKLPFINESGRTIEVGRFPGAASNIQYDGYMAEVCFIDGQQLAASEFGEFDEDSPTIWKPKDVSGLTFGNNGFYLDFEDSANLGNDANGGTDLTESGLAATDSSTDTPTNNFNIMLPIMKQASNLTFSEGNLAVAWPSANTWRTIYSSIMPTAGKWYFEAKNTTSNDNFIGMVGEAGVDNTDDSSISAPASAYSLKNDGNKYNNGSAASYGVSTTTNDIIGVAMDLDNGTLWFSKNGTWMNSATQAEVVAGTTTNAAYSSITVGAAYPYGIGASGKESAGFSFNFGSPPYAISSGNADDNGYGNFEYDVPTGFYSLCTKNLAEYG